MLIKKLIIATCMLLITTQLQSNSELIIDGKISGDIQQGKCSNLGKFYTISVKHLGADINKKFKKASTPSNNSLFASSNKVVGGIEVTKTFTFMATGFTSYLAIRSTKDWNDPSTRTISIKEKN